MSSGDANTAGVSGESRPTNSTDSCASTPIPGESDQVPRVIDDQALRMADDQTSRATQVTNTPRTPALQLHGLWKKFGEKIAVAGIDLTVPAGSFYGLVGPNGAGKTTTLSMATGLLRPDFGTVLFHGEDLWAGPTEAKKHLGVLPDGMRLFDRLTGRQLITYAGLLRGMDRDTVAERTENLLEVLDLLQDANNLVVDYSAGMTKKVSLASAIIHAPRMLVLDEPFEAVDPVSAANIREILHDYVVGGGTVIVSSHVMDLVQRICDHVAVVAGGHILAAGPIDEVRGNKSLEDTFVGLVGGRRSGEGLAWLRTS